MKNVTEKVRKITNTLSGDARDFADAVVSAFEALEAAEEEVSIDDVRAEIEKVAEQFVKPEEVEQEVAEAVAKVRESIMREVRGGSMPVAEKITDSVKRQVVNAIAHAQNKTEALAGIDAIAKANGIEIKKKKNDITGLTYGDIIDYAIQVKQDESDEVYDALYKTKVSKMFYAELDDTNAEQIAKQWDKEAGAGVVKDIQSLAAQGKEISTANIYKMQRIANEDMDDAEEAGELNNLIGQVSAELRKAVKAGIVRAILIGDDVNATGKKITKFESIATKTATDLHTTVLNPATANTVTIKDLALLAEKVKTERKWLFVSPELELELREFTYAAGGTPTLIGEDELAAKIGVEKIVKKDYLAGVEGLHAIILDPDQYWVKEKKETDIAFPQYERNARGFLFELNAGGCIRGLKSTAVLKEA
jgi:hypothetical protein